MIKYDMGFIAAFVALGLAFVASLQIHDLTERLIVLEKQVEVRK